MRYFGFDEQTFRRNVDEALKSVDRILEVHRKPHLAENVDHEYDNKYDLANQLTNVGIIALMNCLEQFGLTADVLKELDNNKTNNQHKATTLRFHASDTCAFLKENEVEVPMERSMETTEETTTTSSSSFFGSTTKATISRVVNRVKEYHWKVGINWEVSLYSGTDVDQKTILDTRSSSMILVTQSNPSKRPPLPQQREHPPIDVPLTWFLQQIHKQDLVSQFKIDTADPKTKTPLRNKQVEDAIDSMMKLSVWASRVSSYFTRTLHSGIIRQNNPATGPVVDEVGSWLVGGIFNPVQPLMEETNTSTHTVGSDATPTDQKSLLGMPKDKTSDSTEGEEKPSPMLSRNDMTNIINEHVQSIEQKIKTIQKSFPAKHLMKPVSVAEAKFVILCGHIDEIQKMYINSMCYIEWMLESQLIAAIGKRVDSSDLDKFVKYHNSKLIRPAPKPFCHSIRRPDHYPDGVLSIEGLNTNNNSSDKKEPIDTFVREVEMARPLQVPLTAASTLELTGKAFLHGWLQHRFQNTSKKYDLVARARQFSSFMLVVGTMAGSNELDPKDAIILQNKDEVIIPLLLNELPSAKEFKDAIQSLSPEQQRFAKSFRSMQLESSVLGVCIVQIKPQLEKLLRLPPDALTKEMKLTQDLMELFVEHQVPSDLLSYDGETDDTSVGGKVENVKSHVAAVMEVVDAAKSKQLREQEQRAKMAEESAKQEAERAKRSLMMRQRERQSAAGGELASIESNVQMKALSTASRRGGRGLPLAARSAASSFAPSPSSVQSQGFSFGAPNTQAAQQSAMLDSMDEALDTVEPTEADGKKSATTLDQAEPLKSDDAIVDFTAIPKMLDSIVEKHDKDGALRSTVVKTANRWVRRRKENLLSDVCVQNLDAQYISSEKNKCFDLLDALCRSGSLPIDCSELHVIICLTHRFEKDVMGTIIQDNINPIEKLEYSTLLFASAILGVAPREIASDEQTLSRLSYMFPLLLEN